jgi:inhibitor of KinA
VSRIVPFGDGALLVVLDEVIDGAVNREVHGLAAAVSRLRTADPRWGAPVPAYSSLLVPYDPLLMGHEEALASLERVVEREAAARDKETGARANETGETDEPREVEGTESPVTIPVRYGGDDGPDLEAVAQLRGLLPADVVRLHSERTYLVFMLGFAPGFAYLGPLAPELVTQRRATPRPRVPAGSVAIAGNQTAVYPLPTPGGWHLLGRTDAVLWDVERRPPALLRPGQAVRFVAVDPSPR